MQIIVANSKGGSGKSTLVLSLTDVLKDVQIVDCDSQGTITVGAKLTGRNKPIKAEEATAKYIIYDTPPYHNEDLRSLFKTADLVLVPVKLGYADLLATKAVVDDLRGLDIASKVIIIFNEVRKPYTNTYKEVSRLFKKNYKDVRIAKAELSNLLAYRRILRESLKGKAKREVENLIKELNL